jgi:hypothetical protein
MAGGEQAFEAVVHEIVDVGGVGDPGGDHTTDDRFGGQHILDRRDVPRVAHVRWPLPVRAPADAHPGKKLS